MSMAHSNKQQPGKDFATLNHFQALDICISNNVNNNEKSLNSRSVRIIV